MHFFCCSFLLLRTVYAKIGKKLIDLHFLGRSLQPCKLQGGEGIVYKQEISKNKVFGSS